MSEFPQSLIEFQSRFPDEAACVGYLFAARWPEGFVCLACGTGKAWPLQSKAWTWECAHCGKQTSVIAGTRLGVRAVPEFCLVGHTHLFRPFSLAQFPLPASRLVGCGEHNG